MKYPGLTMILLAGLSVAGNPGLLIVPGERVGIVPLDISRVELSNLVGDEVLIDTTVHLGEGFMAPGTLVFPGTKRELEITWYDSLMNSTVGITVTGEAYETFEGIYIGMSLTDVNSLLGEFRLLGFAWDYEGQADFSGTSIGDGIYAAFYAGERDTPERLEAWESVLGDGWFSSLNPGMVNLDPRIASISIYSSY